MKSLLEKVKSFFKSLLEKVRKLGMKFWIAITALLAGGGLGFYQKQVAPVPPVGITQPTPAKAARKKAVRKAVKPRKVQ